MSRSHRSTPIIPVCAADSDKAFKVRAHKAERAAVRVRLMNGEDPPSPRLFGDPWDGDKDGKFYRPDWEGWEKRLRK